MCIINSVYLTMQTYIAITLRWYSPSDSNKINILFYISQIFWIIIWLSGRLICENCIVQNFESNPNFEFRLFDAVSCLAWGFRTPYFVWHAACRHFTLIGIKQFFDLSQDGSDLNVVWSSIRNSKGVYPQGLIYGWVRAWKSQKNHIRFWPTRGSIPNLTPFEYSSDTFLFYVLFYFFV